MAHVWGGWVGTYAMRAQSIRLTRGGLYRTWYSESSGPLGVSLTILSSRWSDHA